MLSHTFYYSLSSKKVVKSHIIISEPLFHPPRPPVLLILLRIHHIASNVNIETPIHNKEITLNNTNNHDGKYSLEDHKETLLHSAHSPQQVSPAVSGSRGYGTGSEGSLQGLGQ